MTEAFHARRKCCAECPWRRDVPTGVFPVERFRAMTNTAADMSFVLFQCHKTRDDQPVVCAGFLERGAEHNLSVRLAYRDRLHRLDRSGGYPLYDGYTEMAVANGVDPGDDVLAKCRS